MKEQEEKLRNYDDLTPEEQRDVDAKFKESIIRGNEKMNAEFEEIREKYLQGLCNNAIRAYLQTAMLYYTGDVGKSYMPID